MKTASGIEIACGSGRIVIIQCQIENKKRVSAIDFMNGYQVQHDEVLGEL